MPKFLKGNQLNAELEKIFEEAQEKLIIISPFIKLHSRFIDTLKSKKNNHRLRINIVFGKNENNIAKSFSKNEFEFLKDFPNIKIKYEPRLHAKYYANELSALLSSMNLYDFSQNNNIEFGILTKTNSLTNNLLGDSFDSEAYEYFNLVSTNSKTLYYNKPQYEDKLMGLSKKYIGSKVITNELLGLLDTSNTLKKEKKFKKNINSTQLTGFCIRTGTQIPFNPEKPLSDLAYKSWSKYKDPDYAEKFCHFSGEESNGETSFSKPILKKNWKKAKEKILIINTMV